MCVCVIVMCCMTHPCRSSGTSPNRRLDAPAELDPINASRHLISHTSQHPGLVLDFDEHARSYFDSFCVTFNTGCNKLRKGSNADVAAEAGIACVLPCLHCRPWGVCCTLCDRCEWPHTSPCVPQVLGPGRSPSSPHACTYGTSCGNRSSHL